MLHPGVAEFWPQESENQARLRPARRRPRQRAATTAVPAPDTAVSAAAVLSQGRPLEEVLADPAVASLPRVGTLDASHVTPQWWLGSGDTRRLWAFLDWLAARPQRRVAVVTHYGFVRNLLSFAGRDHVALANCGWVRTAWVRASPFSPVASPASSPAPARMARHGEEPNPFHLDARETAEVPSPPPALRPSPLGAKLPPATAAAS